MSWLRCACVRCSVEERVGRQLAVIGDEVDMQYASIFNKMIGGLSVDENTPYDNFATIARQSVLMLHLSICLSLCLLILFSLISNSSDL